MLNDYPVLIFCLIFGSLIGFLVLGYLVSNNKLKPPLLKPATAIYTLFSVAFLLLIVGGIVYLFVENSGWIPRTREVSVYVKPENWMTGEIKSCASLESKEKEEIGVLLCDQNQMLFEPHVLQVRFWGPIKPDRNKEWKCTRQAALGIALVVIVILYFLIKSKGFRKAALVVLGLMALGALSIYLYFEHDKAESARKLAYAKTLIAKNQIDIIDARVSFSSYDGRPERITGRLRNNSNYTVRSVELHLQFQDCAPNGPCETVGDDNEDVPVNVPPGQSRDFDSSIYGNRISAKGTRAWNYSINSITANVP